MQMAFLLPNKKSYVALCLFFYCFTLPPCSELSFDQLSSVFAFAKQLNLINCCILLKHNLTS